MCFNHPWCHRCLAAWLLGPTFSEAELRLRPTGRSWLRWNQFRWERNSTKHPPNCNHPKLSRWKFHVCLYLLLEMITNGNFRTSGLRIMMISGCLKSKRIPSASNARFFTPETATARLPDHSEVSIRLGTHHLQLVIPQLIQGYLITGLLSLTMFISFPRKM